MMDGASSSRCSAARRWRGRSRRGAQQDDAPSRVLSVPALDRRQHWLASFRTGLGAEGFTDGRNVRIEYRSADGGAEGLPALAADLVRQGAAVIVASGPAGSARRQARNAYHPDRIHERR